MRPAMLLFLAPLAAALPGAPIVVGVGPVTYEDGCATNATVEIEAISRVGETQAFYGTGVVQFSPRCRPIDAHAFVGGQGLEWGLGNCRVLEDGAGECWIGHGWDPERPSHPGMGVYMRLDADGSFYFSRFGDRATGTLTRV